MQRNTLAESWDNHFAFSPLLDDGRYNRFIHLSQHFMIEWSHTGFHFIGNERMDEQKVLPQWAPRVRQDRIRRLYEQDARGIADEDLINNVGYALLSWCQSFLAATAAVQGQALCPVCERTVLHTGLREALLECTCGWSLTWKDYFATIQHKQLSGAEPVVQLFQHFVTGFSAARSPREKLILIDQLLHGFHWYHHHGYTQPVAVNLIEGKLADVIAFLDRLTYGTASTIGIHQTFTEWMEKRQNARQWALKDQQPTE